MAWRATNVKDQRMVFVVAVSRREKNFRQMCAEFGITRTTGYRWWHRYQKQGVTGVEERSRRPHHSPGRTPRDIEQRVVAMRKDRPDWGARKINYRLKEEGVSLPSGTIHRILLRHGLVRDQDRHRPAVQRFEREAPNQLWQMDFKGRKGWDHPVGPLSILDDHSRYLPALEDTGNTGEEGVRETLQQTFLECGVPEQMLMDHGCPWWNGQAARGWTRLSVWLMQQDIELLFSGYRHPQTQGKVERWHRSLTAALLRRGAPGPGQRQAWLNAFRYEYNHLRPHEALGMKTPSQVWRTSSRSYQSHPAPWTYPEGYETAEVKASGQVRVEGQRYWVSSALIGQQVGLIEVAGRLLIYFRRTLVQEVDLRQPTQAQVSA